jgi:hypothetical protein
MTIAFDQLRDPSRSVLLPEDLKFVHLSLILPTVYHAITRDVKDIQSGLHRTGMIRMHADPQVLLASGYDRHNQGRWMGAVMIDDIGRRDVVSGSLRASACVEVAVETRKVAAGNL